MCTIQYNKPFELNSCLAGWYLNFHYSQSYFLQCQSVTANRNRYNIKMSWFVIILLGGLILLTQISLPNQLSSFSISASQLEINGQRSNDSSNFNGLKKGRCLKMENFIWSLFWNCLIRIACSHVDHLIEFSELIHIRGLNK